MENNNMNGQQANWQQALNQFEGQSAQPQQTQYAQPQQAQYTQPQQTQYTQPQQAQYTQPQQAQYTQPQQQFVQPEGPVYSANEFAVAQPVKKNKVLPIVLIIVAAAIVIGGVIFACFTFFGGNKGGYENTERRFFANAKNEVTNIVNNTNKTAEQTTISVSFPADVTGGNDYGSAIFTTKSYIDTDADKLYTSCTIKSDDRDYLTANLWVEGSNIYAQIPELSDTSLMLNIEEYAESIVDASSSSGSLNSMVTIAEMSDAFADDSREVLLDTINDSEISALASVSGTSILESIDYEALNELFSEENVEAVVTIIANAYFNNFKAEDFTDGKLETAEKDINCSIYKIKFSMGNFVNFMIECLKEFKNNDSLYNGLIEATGLSEDDFDDIISTFEEQLEEIDEDDLETTIGEMVVYTLNGNIVARDIVIGDEDSEQSVLRLITVDNGDIFEYSVSLESANSNMYVGISGKVKDNKYEATGKAEINDETYFTLEATFEKDTYNGDYELNFGKNDVSVVFTISGDENEKTFDFTGKSADKDVVYVTIVNEKIDFEEIEIPSGDDVIEISDATTAESALQEYAKEASTSLQKILESTSSGDDIISVLIQYAAMGAGAIGR